MILAYRIKVQVPVGIGYFRRHRSGWEDDIKVDLEGK
jgi:hypothetical protein